MSGEVCRAETVCSGSTRQTKSSASHADPLDWLARLLLLCCLLGLTAAFCALVAGHLLDALCASAFAYVTGVGGALGRRVARSAL